MACMEYSCRRCDWNEESNEFRKVCPKCGSTDIRAWFDEKIDSTFQDESIYEDIELENSEL